MPQHWRPPSLIPWLLSTKRPSASMFPHVNHCLRWPEHSTKRQVRSGYLFAQPVGVFITLKGSSYNGLRSTIQSNCVSSFDPTKFSLSLICPDAMTYVSCFFCLCQKVVSSRISTDSFLSSRLYYFINQDVLIRETYLVVFGTTSTIGCL